VNPLRLLREGAAVPGAALGGALDRLSPGRRRRRLWVGVGKAHIEVRGVHDPARKLLVRDVERALHALPGVQRAQVNAVAGRVIVAFDPEGPSTEDLLGVIEGVEEAHDVHNGRFSHERPDHPGDIEPIRRQGIAIGADVVALSGGVLGQLLRAASIPAELGSLVALAENEPRFRRFLEQHLGVALTDLGLGVTSAFVQSLSQGPLSLVTDITHRANQLGELRAMRRAWERREAELCDEPRDEALDAVTLPPRQAPLGAGPVEGYADVSGALSVAGAAAALVATRSPRRAGGIVTAAVPKAARHGRDAFAARLGRELATRDVIVLGSGALRRLDRVDVVVLDAAVLTIGRLALSALTKLTVPATVASRAAVAGLSMLRGRSPTYRSELRSQLDGCRGARGTARAGDRRSACCRAPARRARRTRTQPANDRGAWARRRAVLEGGDTAGVEASNGLGGWKLLGELAFEPARGYHAVVGDSPSGPRVSVKGAPEVLPRCATWRAPEGVIVIDRKARRRVEAEVERLASQGLRVLAVAERPASASAELADERVSDMELFGFLGLADGVRPTAAAAVADLRAAGVSVVMITGDHPSTAAAIAKELHILNGAPVLTEADLDGWDDDRLDATLAEATVFARVTPAHKMRIIRACQRIGRTVAMTGDGANDAPAIRLAHTGIALGGRGSPAAREAADVVVVDDRIETIIDAIVEGRAMWASVRDALAILIGGNLGEVGFILASTAIAGASPLGARQMLLVNLLTDMLPAMTIALRSPSRRSPEELLHEGPEASLGGALARQIGMRAATTTAGATGAWLLAR
jgi:phosphoserine phosphatase/copper chaperone CopZ